MGKVPYTAKSRAYRLPLLRSSANQLQGSSRACSSPPPWASVALTCSTWRLRATLIKDTDNQPLHRMDPPPICQFALTSTPTGLPWWLRWQRICPQCRRPGFDPWVGKISWRREWLPTLAFLPGKFQAKRLAHYSLWGCKESQQQLNSNNKW